MPLIRYNCSCKKNISKFFRAVRDVPPVLLCECGLEAKRQFSSPNTANIVTIDNGVMAKALDINLEVIKSNEEDSTKDFSDYKNPK